MTQLNNGRTQRKSLANEIDRLDNILDGLDEALAGAVEMAVREVVGHVVKEAVEATLKEVLSNPELIRTVITRHAPVATPVPATQPVATPAPRKTLKESIKEKLSSLWKKTCETASHAKRRVHDAWSWCLSKVRGVGSCLASIPASCKSAWQSLVNTVKLAWRFRTATGVALAGGMLSGLVAYLAGPVISSALCGVGGAALTLAGMVLWPIYRLITGEDARV